MTTTDFISTRLASRADIPKTDPRARPGGATTAAGRRSWRELPRDGGGVLQGPARGASRARTPKASAGAESTDPKAGLIRQVIGGQSWHLAHRAANLGKRAADTERKITIEKSLLAMAAVISIVLALAYGVDLLTGWPFDRHSLLMDITYSASGLVLASLSWLTYREMR